MSRARPGPHRKPDRNRSRSRKSRGRGRGSTPRRTGPPAGPGAGRPRAGRGAAPPPPATGPRERLARVSRPWLVRLTGLPKPVVALAVGAPLVAGLLAPPPWGPALLVPPTVFVVWLLVLSWSVLGPAGRAVRLLTIGLLVAAIVTGLVAG